MFLSLFLYRFKALKAILIVLTTSLPNTARARSHWQPIWRSFLTSLTSRRRPQASSEQTWSQPAMHWLLPTTQVPSKRLSSVSLSSSFMNFSLKLRVLKPLEPNSRATWKTPTARSSNSKRSFTSPSRSNSTYWTSWIPLTPNLKTTLPSGTKKSSRPSLKSLQLNTARSSNMLSRRYMSFILFVANSNTPR